MPSITGSFHPVSHDAVREIFISYHSLHRGSQHQRSMRKSQGVGIVLWTRLGVAGVWDVPNHSGIRAVEPQQNPLVHIWGSVCEKCQIIPSGKAWLSHSPTWGLSPVCRGNSWVVAPRAPSVPSLAKGQEGMKC